MVYSIRSPLSLTYILYMLDLSLSVSADDRRIMYKYWRESHERGRFLAPRQDFSSEFPAILQLSTYLQYCLIQVIPVIDMRLLIHINTSSF